MNREKSFHSNYIFQAESVEKYVRTWVAASHMGSGWRLPPLTMAWAKAIMASALGEEGLSDLAA